MGWMRSCRAACLVLLLLTALSAATGAAEPAGHVAGEVLVKLRPGAAGTAMAASQRLELGLEVLEAIPALGLYRLGVPAGQDVDEAVDRLGHDPACEFAEPNRMGRGGMGRGGMGRGGGFVPDDPFFELQWHLHNTGQTFGTPGADIDALAGWEISRGDPSIVLAVLDSGIDTDGPEFAGRLLPGYDFVDEDDDPEADHNHGIQVTGLAAANADNGIEVAGVDHAARILPVKVLDQFNLGSTFDLAQGLTFAADAGAHVINLSLIDYPVSSPTLDAALAYARDAGAILISCAGNGGLGDADVSGPGASALTISVANTDHDDERWANAGTGRALDLVAPGHIVITVGGFFGGCSSATPLVAGIATLLLSIDPSLGHDEVRDILIRSAEDQVGPPSEDTPGRDDFFGHGRVNLRAALELARAGLSDVDEDGVPDRDDRCVEVADPAQGDADRDGYGDVCDPDYDNDGAVGIPDFNVLRAQFGRTETDPGFDPAVDHDGDGAVGIPDFAVFRAHFGGPPGPSGLECAGTAPCP
ncbi:MAG: S8 family serine peptidase [Myxococcota bacterium]|nr:S8 family serine peptidase [Myxococcota bacterium]